VAAGPSAPAQSSLSNGLTIVTRQRADSRVVAIDLAVRAGARYEGPEAASAARFLQQALMLGTERWPSRDRLLRAITARGGELTAMAVAR
jgi:predicted Zn-dependent peptidase